MASPTDIPPVDPRRSPGTPAWWSARGDVPRRGRPAVDSLHIVKTALRLVDERGVQSFSLRLLAEELGSGTATLYRHFATKGDLLAHVVDEVLGEVDAPSAGTSTRGDQRAWRDVLADVGEQLYATLRRHPDVVPLLMGVVPVGPHALARRERALSALLACGLPVDLAARAFTAVGHYVIGFVLQQPGRGGATEDGPELAAFYGALDPRDHPATVRAAEALTSVPADEEFRFGLDLLLDGLERRHDAHAAPDAPGI
ncbi:TetR/AcrR family transcriptional regulator [Sanguibacter sp. 25GB23B1]|uniref:TetR/AcrR family transcriptional regulator n=1 Tax=unclassified Sanguibacter TaxID=2645534 RepID=UPI0032AFF6E9